MIVYREAIGDFPAIPALDDTWRLTHEDPPPIGEMVEVCWARHKDGPDSEPQYQCSKGSVRKLAPPDSRYGHTWRNERGEDLVFNPTFWRPIQAGG